MLLSYSQYLYWFKVAHKFAFHLPIWTIFDDPDFLKVKIHMQKQIASYTKHYYQGKEDTRACQIKI